MPGVAYQGVVGDEGYFNFDGIPVLPPELQRHFLPKRRDPAFLCAMIRRADSSLPRGVKESPWMSEMITPEDLADAPRDNVGAFLHLERLARERHKEAVDELVDRYGENVVTSEWDFAYMRAVLGAASACGVDELSDWTLPRYGEEDWGQDCRNFKATAEFVAVKLLIEHSRRRHIYSVAIDAATKATLQRQIDDVRDFINKSDMPLSKRERLLACLNAFQAELDQERTDLQKLGALMCEVTNTAEEVVRYVAPKLWRMASALGTSREAEDERERVKQLSAPDRERTFRRVPLLQLASYVVLGSTRRV